LRKDANRRDGNIHRHPKLRLLALALLPEGTLSVGADRGANAMVRMLQEEDEAPWRALWTQYLDFYGSSVDAAVYRRTWSRLLDPAEPVFGALAIADGEAVGLVHYIFHRSTWTVGDYCYLQDLFVAPAARGGGHGRALIAHVYSEAAAVGASRVHWLTHESNATAIALYERVAERSGFIQFRKSVG
jgi:GNAT superfamily N-acetyltransferase